jgi:alpha-mannosidase
MLENEKYRVSLNSNGDISSVFDKKIKKEILKKPITTGIFDYNGSSSWPAWELNYEELNREPQNKTKVKTIKVIENGPCRVALEVVKEFGDSTFTSVIALSNGGNVVEVYTEAEWRSKRHLAKEIFSFTAESPVATYDLGLGAIKRGNMNDKLFEVPAQKWADITDKSEDFGISVISECKYGWDKFDDNTLRLTLMHTPYKNYKVDSMQSMMELGLNRYSYAIFSHKGNVAHETQTESRNFVMPMASFVVSNHEGNQTEYSFGSLTGNAILRAMKKAENSDEIIIRIGESEKCTQTDVTFSLECGIESAREIFASEEHIADYPLTDGKLVFDLKPYEIKSFALKVKKTDAPE